MKAADEASRGLRTTYAAALWLLWGMLLGLLKLLYSFLPLFNLLDVIVFGMAGSLIGRRYESGSHLRLALAMLPSLIVTAWALSNLSFSLVAEGIGTGWIASALLIPIAAILGAHLGARVSNTDRTA